MKLTVPATLLSIQAAAVLAAPVADKSPLSARQGGTIIWEPEEEGSGFATVEYGDGMLNYGARVPSTILDIIRDECGQTSCNPSGGFGFSTRVVNSDRASDRSYTISVQGSFALEGQGSKEQLLELAKMGFEEVYNAGVAKRHEGVHYIVNECPAHQTICPGKCRSTSHRTWSPLLP